MQRGLISNNGTRSCWVHTPAQGPQVIAVDSPLSTFDARTGNRVSTCTHVRVHVDVHMSSGTSAMYGKVTISALAAVGRQE